VLQQATAQREAFLRWACNGDEALGREVRSLLDAQKEGGSILETRPSMWLPGTSWAKAAISRSAGPYRITAWWARWAAAAWV
jgi:hypothetical protein